MASIFLSPMSARNRVGDGVVSLKKRQKVTMNTEFDTLARRLAACTGVTGEERLRLREAATLYLALAGPAAVGEDVGVDVEAAKDKKHTKIKGTIIVIQKGNIPVRVVNASGKHFAPDDIEGVQAHLKSLGISAEDSTGPKNKKELTPEELLKIQEKRAEKFKAKVEAECREMVSMSTYKGEVAARGGYSCAWIRPTSPDTIPGPVQLKLASMNTELREKAGKKFAGGTKDEVIYADLNDVVEEGLVLKAGTMVEFKLYTDLKGVGCCEIRSG
eukprot:gnl/TRDRNA2_/TRDRNA2_42424_c0_seq1.p1 gnl/TRDRNA2_/TRDRNA2_42424_c0~~gnl/TRDRNA2_/TRDRNA2_42424_c0_seq1.p1  ORF type:complete len:273 (-),score=64.33 gnl/TRDRNA2_/TRDRNA2_42424_c0_seq1:62-880(-)